MAAVDINRSAMALRLADTLRQFPNGDDPDVVGRMSDDSWRAAADAAGCRPGYLPSPATRAAVVAILVQRAAYRADPFEGLS